MKYLIIIACIVAPLLLGAQKTETFYDYNWQPCEAENARFYGTLQKTDSGWLRKDYFLASKSLQMQALYEDKACKIQNGDCFYFYANGKPSITGRMLHGKKEGICLQYYFNGMMADSAMYHNGVSVGNRIMWHRNGYPSDSIAHVNDSTDVHISWFDDGSLFSAGYLLNGKKYGKWKYYHRNGTLAAEEKYWDGEVIAKSYFKDDGSPQTDTAFAKTSATFKKGGNEGWKKYLEKNSHWPTGLSLANTNFVTIGVEFTINEEGKPEDIDVVIPFHPEFDKIAEDIIRQSPVWIPAMSNNRKVKERFRQPLTFQQEE